ncbi:hypothetical protein Nepgr_001482 [Nepenthes gracilis]|uniref:Uncharacterized protein n=1 Tax=Nepenthes gracilis TaxID=150966 RepID=A0AAD3RXL7_NEPGR|nr:hypothetical protein Nepgr_001482 [Nepenthes gracilis]
MKQLDFKRFVDLLRTCHLPSLLRSSSNKGTVFGTTITETYLHSVGVKFVPCPEKSLLDIEFDPNRQSLKIAPLKFDDSTEQFFWNLLVFE